MFIATANYRGNIPEPLKDRMEIIEVPGYTRSEKRSIAEHFLVPKQLKEHGLSPDQLLFEREGIETIVDLYTREAGVRGLEREIAAVCRDVTVKLAEGQTITQILVTPSHVRELLGPERNLPEITERKLVPGIAIGLSVSGAGGDILIIEATRMPGKGEIRITGSLRNIMKEAAATAVSYVRSRADRLKLDPEWLRTIDLHLHIPRGGSTRDGANAGVAMFVAVTSLLLDAPARSDVAVTGELTLRGNILPVSGVKDQVLAAHRAGIREVILPARNERDLDEVPDEVKNELRVHFVQRIDEILPLVLRAPEPSDDADRDDAPQSSRQAHP